MADPTPDPHTEPRTPEPSPVGGTLLEDGAPRTLDTLRRAIEQERSLVPSEPDDFDAGADAAYAYVLSEWPEASTGADAPPPLTYEQHVEAMAAALHEDCRLEWQAIAVTDPTRQVTMHGADAHYGNAHDLVHRLRAEQEGEEG